MSEDQFTKLFKYMQSMEKRIDVRFDKQDKEIADLKGAVAELGGQIRDYHQEMIMLARKRRQNGTMDTADSQRNRCKITV